jgi:PAS domain S-box-containing protein
MPKNPINILYVDDDPDDFFLVSTLLKKVEDSEYILERASTFPEALEKLNKTYDVFLVDYKLGKDTGLDLIKEIKSKQPHSPVIMLTGMSEGYIDREALTLGASDYLIKGEFDSKTLDRVLRYALRDSQIIKQLDTAGRKFRSIFERAGDPFILIDTSGKILEGNPVFVQKFGLDPHDISPASDFYISDLFDEADSRMDLVEKLDRKLELFEFESALIGKEGHSFEALISIAKQDADIFQVMIKDLSAIKNREEEDLNLKKFSSTGRMARLLAHEVKNPLTTIVLAADQLQMELPAEVLKESGDLIEVIQRNCTRINELVTQLLESTRFSELNIAKYSINTLLDEALEVVKDRIDLKKIKLIKEYDPEICDVRVDGEKVKIALTNLIVNAVEAMEESVGELLLKTYVKGDLCRIKIRDNGLGISKENLERLFEPFFTSKNSGSGLGLTNTQNIILSHNGSIRVSSKEGEGTTFSISFQINGNNPDELK